MYWIELPLVGYEEKEGESYFDPDVNDVVTKTQYIETDIGIRMVNLAQVQYFEPSFNNPKYVTAYMDISKDIAIDIAIEYNELREIVELEQELTDLNKFVNNMMQTDLFQENEDEIN